uniref:Chromosome 8 open reading frame 90 n=1 Tax=Aotus nancymaae TaxID=37293 RepID=A0A2K5CQD3_AOTNA
MASPCPGAPSPAGLTPPSVATPGPVAPPEPAFPDIYGGDAQLWEAHFCGIGRAYRALGKQDDFSIRVLTEDFTLPFPFAWPPGPDPARGPLFYDPRDCSGFDFLLRGPGASPPALLRPLHAAAQAALRKRYVRARGPGPARPTTAPPDWPRPRCCPENSQNK